MAVLDQKIKVAMPSRKKGEEADAAETNMAYSGSSDGGKLSLCCCMMSYNGSLCCRCWVPCSVAPSRCLCWSLVSVESDCACDGAVCCTICPLNRCCLCVIAVRNFEYWLPKEMYSIPGIVR